MSSNFQGDRPNPYNHPVILFDGICNLCNGWVNFVIDRDPSARFRFAALQSDAGLRLIRTLPNNQPDSIVLVEGDQVFVKSAAVFRILRQLEGGWSNLTVLSILPRFVVDAVYDLIARHRYSWFGRRDACRVPTPDLQSRFL